MPDPPARYFMAEGPEVAAEGARPLRPDTTLLPALRLRVDT